MHHLLKVLIVFIIPFKHVFLPALEHASALPQFSVFVTDEPSTGTQVICNAGTDVTCTSIQPKAPILLVYHVCTEYNLSKLQHQTRLSTTGKPISMQYKLVRMYMCVVLKQQSSSCFVRTSAVYSAFEC